MTPAAEHLTVDEYDRVYGHESVWEYWFGEARRKPMPTHLYGVLAGLLFDLLHLAGYVTAVEAELRTAPTGVPGLTSMVRKTFGRQGIDALGGAALRLRQASGIREYGFGAFCGLRGVCLASHGDQQLRRLALSGFLSLAAATRFVDSWVDRVILAPSFAPG